jgi:NTE family protein
MRDDMDRHNRLGIALAYWSRPEASPSQSRNDLRRPEVSASNLSALVADARESHAVTDYREKDVLALQGGGALGAYQAGAYEALCDGGHMPRWVAGTSIGAINAAIIAGNRPEHRVARLREFWEKVSSRLLGWPFAEHGDARKIFNETSAALSAAGGVPGFFDPRIPPAVVMPQGTREAISIYDTGPLQATLNGLVDFDILNSGAVRLSIGAVQVLSGNMKYFDTASQVIGPEHVMASGALPPGFPPIEIDGQPYWDGGLVSNTPLDYVLERSGPREDMCIFQIDLFSAKGRMPQSLFDVAQREKEIRYSSRTRLNTDVFQELQTIRRAIRQLRSKVPRELSNDPDWQFLDGVSCGAAVTIVLLIHRRAAYWTQSSDYEFSRHSMDEHWQAGRSDVERTMSDPAWKNRTRPEEGVMVLDLTRDIDAVPRERNLRGSTPPPRLHPDVQSGDSAPRGFP